VWRSDTLVSTYSYDANGNRITHVAPTSVDSGTYDAQDRMLSYAGAQYTYGLNGDLQTKIVGTDTTKYTGVYPALAGMLSATLRKLPCQMAMWSSTSSMDKTEG
jgi:hypothetical protein